MMDEGPAGGEGRRRGRGKNRMRQGRRKRRGGGGGRGPAQPERYLPEPARDDSSILGARPLKQLGERRPVEDAVRLDAFGLFCAYHLGVTPDDRYQKPNLDEIARRFGTNVEGIRKALVEFKIDEASIRQARFDIEGAQMDIRVAPEGISRVELARELFSDFMASRDDQ
jgi:hypothetical protein